MFVDRWSHRAFADRTVDSATLATVLEAVRWTPSSMNEQPWRWVVATNDEDRERVVNVMHEGNQRWASHAPVLLVLTTKRHFDRNGRENRLATWDAGAAWMALALQAHLLGLSTRAMGGIDLEAAATTLGIPETHQVGFAVALGWPAPADALPEDLQGRERPNSRLPIGDLVHEGNWGRPWSAA